MGAVLRRLWRAPSAPHSFRPLSAMTAHWINETLEDAVGRRGVAGPAGLLGSGSLTLTPAP